MRPVPLLSLLVLAAASVLAANYPENRPPLKPVPYLPLPLGSVKAEGWLKKQLELQRDGLTGHLPEIMDAVGPDSAWLGGTGEDWEKGPYYVRGLLSLAYGLDDEEMKKEAQKWIEWTLQSQRKDGFFGPSSNNDWWPRMVMTHILRDYADATGDERIIPFLEKYYAHMLRELPKRPVVEWGRARAGDEIETVLWLYNRNGDKSLLKLAELLKEQAYPWADIYTNNRFLDFGTDYHPKHNVNVPQAMKLPALSYLISKNETEIEAIEKGLEHLNRDHGLPLGMNGGTEFLAGKSTTQGIETCSTVERMLSDVIVARILGDAWMGDNLEELAFNALPAALTPDIKQHVYYALPNTVTAVQGHLSFNQDYPNGITPAAPSGYPCCIFNFHMGWPKFVQSSWAATTDKGLAVIAYGPTTVTAKVGDGVEATIQETTDYPFADRIALDVKVAKPVKFPLELRIPGWCKAPVIRVNGEPVANPKPGTFHRIDRQWKTGDRVEIEFPMEVRVDRGVVNSISVHRGPLLYSLRLNQDWHVKESRPGGFDALEVTTADPWNYALAIEPDPASAIEFKAEPMPENPYDPKTPPAILVAKGKLVSDWTLAWNGRVALDPPPSPVESDAPLTTLELVPAGSQTLRVTSFPWLGKPQSAPKELSPDFEEEGLSRWIPYAGGWMIENGALKATAHSAPGGKAVALMSKFSDLEYEADVTVGEGGEAGLIFRVTKPSQGADAYNGYYVGLQPEKRVVVLGKADGSWHELATALAAIEFGKSYRLRVVAKGPKIDVYLNDKQVLSEEDLSFAEGSVGVRDYFPNGDQRNATFSGIKAKAL